MEAAKWYESKRSGLGDEFLLALDASMSSILRNPNQNRKIYGDIRRVLTRRFPYGIFYIVEGNVVYILAIVHISRNPTLWRGRKK